MKQSDIQKIAVIKCYYRTNIKDYKPVTYEIHIDDDIVTGIKAESAQFIYDELGKLLAKEGSEK